VSADFSKSVSPRRTRLVVSMHLSPPAGDFGSLCIEVRALLTLSARRRALRAGVELPIDVTCYLTDSDEDWAQAVDLLTDLTGAHQNDRLDSVRVLRINPAWRIEPPCVSPQLLATEANQPFGLLARAYTTHRARVFVPASRCFDDRRTSGRGITCSAREGNCPAQRRGQP
jgi:hypothetical protein